jgi:hypothetical protein
MGDLGALAETVQDLNLDKNSGLMKSLEQGMPPPLSLSLCMCAWG